MDNKNLHGYKKPISLSEAAPAVRRMLGEGAVLLKNDGILPLKQDVKKIAQSKTGQQLYQLLQQQNGQGLNSAMESAAKGNYKEAKKILSQLLKDPKAKQLMEQMGGSNGSDGR